MSPTEVVDGLAYLIEQIVVVPNEAQGTASVGVGDGQVEAEEAVASDTIEVVNDVLPRHAEVRLLGESRS